MLPVLVAAVLIFLIAFLLCSYVVTSTNGRVAVAVLAVILLAILLLDVCGVVNVLHLPRAR